MELNTWNDVPGKTTNNLHLLHNMQAATAVKDGTNGSKYRGQSKSKVRQGEPLCLQTQNRQLATK